MRKKKIAVLASSRATYGYKRNIIGLIDKSEKLELQLIVTGMHLLKEYGYSIREIEKDGYPIAAKVDMSIGGGTTSSWTKSLGVEIQSLVQVFDMLSPDLLLVTGDRAEMFGGAITAAYMNIPIAHIQAGDVSGHIDGNVRHAITKLSHIHFPSCQDSADRVANLGEEPWRIFNVGAPQLDDIVRGEKLSKEQLFEIIGFDLNEETLMMVQHPVLVEQQDTTSQIIETLEAIKECGKNTIIIYPNIDSGNDEIIQAINKYEKLPHIKAFKNLDRNVYISLLASVSVLVGNSSSGILEASSFKLPVVNIGNRQRGRMQAKNIINSETNRKEIKAAIDKCLSEEFITSIQDCENPYGDGYSSERIVKVLEELDYDERLIDKRITY